MVWRPAERMTRQENDMETTEHLDKPATSGSTASAIKAEEYDLLILGSGAAGKLLSWTLAKKGMKVAVIERKFVGGSCPNIACLPSKNIIHSVVHQAKEGVATRHVHPSFSLSLCATEITVCVSTLSVVRKRYLSG